MLQGTFETLSLPEVLGLLAGARKSGALWLEAGPVSGVIHLRDGHCHATEADDRSGPIEQGSELLTRLVDVCFAVMCQDSGAFRFAADEPAPWACTEPVELSDALVEVDRLLKQWREILRVIPSLECRPSLLEGLEVDEIVFDRDRWSILVAIDGRRTVREIVQRTERPVMELCQALLELIEAGAVGVIDPAAARVPDVDPEPDADPAPEPEPEPALEAPAEPELQPAVADEPAVVLSIVPEAPAEAAEQTDAPVPVEAFAEPEPEAVEAREAAEAAVANGTDGPDRSDGPDKGAFLRLFSGLRES